MERHIPIESLNEAMKCTAQEQKIDAILHLAHIDPGLSLSPKQRAAFHIVLTRVVLPKTQNEAKLVSNALVEVAGRDLTSADFLVNALPFPPDFGHMEFETQKIDAVMTILKNNPQLLKDKNLMEQLREAAVEISTSYTYTEFCDSTAAALRGDDEIKKPVGDIEHNAKKQVDSFFSKLVEFHGVVGQKESVEVLAMLCIDRGIAVQEAIASLGSIGHHYPGLALAALKRVKKDPTYAVHAMKVQGAHNRIIDELTSSNDFYSVKRLPLEFSDVFIAVLKKMGFSGSDIRRLKKDIQGENINSLSGAVGIVDKNYKVGFHPLMDKTRGKFLNSVKDIRIPVDSRIAPALTLKARTVVTI
jgi:hypothetical protein